MSNIPFARTTLQRLAFDLRTNAISRLEAADEINTLLQMLARKSPVRRAPVKKRGITPDLRSVILRYASDHPKAHLQDIADRFGVNPGRVSEILNGLR